MPTKKPTARDTVIINDPAPEAVVELFEALKKALSTKPTKLKAKKARKR